MVEPGKIIILNGAPRSGKSSIVAAIQEHLAGVWVNLGVDFYVRDVTPQRFRPGIGLRPGGERPDLEPLLPMFFAALYESIAAHSRFGLNVVADVGQHDSYSRPLNILPDCARRLAGLPVLFVGVRCPIDVIMQRREQAADGRHYVKGSSDNPVPEPVRRWQDAVHAHGVYDLEVDTSKLDPAQCAERIAQRLKEHGNTASAFQRLASLSSPTD
jgi:chloramphenicol 3-O phosphotransferase